MNDPAVLVDTPFDRPGDKNIPAARALNLTGSRITRMMLALIGSLLEKHGSLVITNALIEAPGESAKMLGFGVVTHDGEQMLVSEQTLPIAIP